MRRTAVVLLALLGVGVGGCQRPSEPAPLLVFGAASAGDALREAVARYEQHDDGKPIALHVGASGALVRQIELGAPADVFVSASALELERLLASGRAEPSDRWPIAANRLMIVVPRGVVVPSSPFALAGPGFERIAIGNPATAPVGRYAMAAFDALGLRAALEPRLLTAEHARQVLAWVERGEVDAGLVYATDARHARSSVESGPLLDAATHPAIRYEALLIATHDRRARRFASWLSGDEARAIFAAHGFITPEVAP